MRAASHPPARIVFRRNNLIFSSGCRQLFFSIYLEGEGMFTMRVSGVLLRLDVVLLGKELGEEVLRFLAVTA